MKCQIELQAEICY